MSKMTDFVHSSQSKRLDRVRKAKTKEERRMLEEKLLKPEELPPYTLESSKSTNEVNSKTVMLVFGNIEHVELLAKYFKISEYKGKNIRASNLGLLLDFLKALDSGKLIYNKESHRFYCCVYNDDSVSLSPKKVKRIRR